MWIFTKDSAINTDNVLIIAVEDSGIDFVVASINRTTTIDCGTPDRAKYIYNDIMSELGKGTLIFNVDRRLSK